MKCPNCGKELNPGDKFCKGCGTKVEGNLAGAGTTEPANKKSRLK